MIGGVIVGIGEVLWDVFPDGPRFGGAPANFACCAAALSGGKTPVAVVSGVGRDDLGSRALATLSGRGIDVSHVTAVDFPTGTVKVTLDAAGRASYVIASGTAWDNFLASEPLTELAGEASAVCFGTLAQRSPVARRTIRRFLQQTSDACLRVLDVNLRAPYWDRDVLLESLSLANVLKLNEEELPILAEALGLETSTETLTEMSKDSAELAMLHRLAADYSLRLVALTQGEKGATLVTGAGEVDFAPGLRVEVADTVGAGDAFTAALVVGLLRGLPMETINRWATRVAAYVASQPGAAPALPAELLVP